MKTSTASTQALSRPVLRAGALRARRALSVRASGEQGLVVAGTNFTSAGLALSGSVMSATGAAVYTVREDVKVTRSEESGNTTVTIKVGSRSAAVGASSYFLPSVGPVDDGSEARAKAAALEEQLRAAQAELEEAERRKRSLEEARSKGAAGPGARVPLSDASLARLAAEGGLTWSKEGPGNDASYSFYNIYRSGEPLEAVQATADSGFAALAAWLKEQQQVVELNFYMERDRLQRIAAAEREAALAALAERLEAEAAATLAAELQSLRFALDVEKAQALEKARAEAAAATAAALQRQEQTLAAAHEAALQALRANYEGQLTALRAAMEAMEEKHAAATAAAAAAALADKKAALEAMKRGFLAKYALVRSQLAAAQDLSIDGCLTRIEEIKVELQQFQTEAEAQAVL